MVDESTDDDEKNAEDTDNEDDEAEADYEKGCDEDEDKDNDSGGGSKGKGLGPKVLLGLTKALVECHEHVHCRPRPPAQWRCVCALWTRLAARAERDQRRERDGAVWLCCRGAGERALEASALAASAGSCLSLRRSLSVYSIEIVISVRTSLSSVRRTASPARPRRSRGRFGYIVYAHTGHGSSRADSLSTCCSGVADTPSGSARAQTARSRPAPCRDA